MSFNIKVVDKIDSTNTYFKKNAKSLKNKDVLIAKEQTGGRGQLGKSFESSVGGLYMSIYLDALYETHEMPFITVLCGIAVRRAILKISGIDFKIKWPNDLIVNDKKICGILNELVQVDNGYGVVVGIGLNVNNSDNLPEVATSLKEVGGKDYDIYEIAKEILKNIEKLYMNMDKQKLADEMIENLYKPSEKMREWFDRYKIKY